MTTTRTGLGIPLLFWTAGFLTMRVIENKKSRHTTKRLIVLVLLLLTFGILMNGVEEQLRVAATPTFSAFQDRALRDRARTTYLGHLSAFSTWFDTCLEQPGGAMFGARTFGVLSTCSGFLLRVTGVWPVGVFVGGGRGVTNIYTIQRGAIEDFTLVGALFWFLLLGIVGGFGYRACRHGQILGAPVLLTFYLWTGWYIVSVFTYNSVCLAVLFTSGYVVLLMNHRAKFGIRGGLRSITFRVRYGDHKLDRAAPYRLPRTTGPD